MLTRASCSCAHTQDAGVFGLLASPFLLAGAAASGVATAGAAAYSSAFTGSSGANDEEEDFSGERELYDEPEEEEEGARPPWESFSFGKAFYGDE